MAKVKTYQDISNAGSWEELRRFVSDAIGAIISEVNGRLSLTGNLQTQSLPVSFSSAGQEVGLGHGLGFIPNGYIPIMNSSGSVLFDGQTPNTKDTIYLRSTGAGTYTVLVF